MSRLAAVKPQDTWALGAARCGAPRSRASPSLFCAVSGPLPRTGLPIRRKVFPRPLKPPFSLRPATPRTPGESVEGHTGHHGDIRLWCDHGRAPHENGDPAAARSGRDASPPISTNLPPPLTQLQRPEFLRRMQKQLDLTASQRDEIAKIMKESQERSRPLWKKIAPQLREEVKRVREEINKVLTPDQQKKFNELLKARPRKSDGAASVKELRTLPRIRRANQHALISFISYRPAAHNKTRHTFQFMQAPLHSWVVCRVRATLCHLASCSTSSRTSTHNDERISSSSP